jgi:hypothetical protein
VDTRPSERIAPGDDGVPTDQTRCLGSGGRRHRALPARARISDPGIHDLRRSPMLSLGVILLILALLLDISVLWSIGIILTVIGLILAVLGVLDRSFGPRRYYY